MIISNKVNWAIEPDRCALLIHDMQPHYLGALPDEACAQLIANVRAIGAACLDRGIPIFASQVPPAREGRERGLMMEMWGSGPAAGNHDIDPRLGLADHHVWTLTKRSYSAFYGNDFEVLLRRLGREAILIVGVYTSIGCHCSAMDAFMRDMRAFLVNDATADLCPADHEAGLTSAARTCACVVDTASVCRALSGRGPRSILRLDGIDVC